MPLLERIADDYAGRFALAKVNTDEEQQVAAHFGIRSIPTVMLFDQGQAVEQFVGVQPEQAIRALLDRYLAQRGGRRLRRSPPVPPQVSKRRLPPAMSRRQRPHLRRSRQRIRSALH